MDRASRKGARVVAVLAVATLIATGIGGPARAADDKAKAQDIIEKAQLTMASFQKDPNLGALRDLMKKAHGVLIWPDNVRGAFIIGGSGGSGVLLAKDKAGKWNGPAFYTLGQASFGFQAGVDVSQAAFAVMTERGITNLLNPTVKFGGDVSGAAGPVGIGTQAATAGLSADLISFSKAKGLYGGISFDGAVISTRPSLNKAYYGKEVSPAQILIEGQTTNPQAARLIKIVSDMAKAQ